MPFQWKLVFIQFLYNSPLPFVKFWNCRTDLTNSSCFLKIFKKFNLQKISSIYFANFLTWYEAQVYTKKNPLQGKLTGDAINLAMQILIATSFGPYIPHWSCD